jgi:hypothetical protein
MENFKLTLMGLSTLMSTVLLFSCLQFTRKRKMFDTQFSSAQPEQGKVDNGEVQSSKRCKLDEHGGDSSSSHCIPQTHNRKRKHGRKEQEEGFQPYDYSKVDFSRFQGGSKISVTNDRNEGKPKVSLNIGK